MVMFCGKSIISNGGSLSGCGDCACSLSLCSVKNRIDVKIATDATTSALIAHGLDARLPKWVCFRGACRFELICVIFGQWFELGLSAQIIAFMNS